MQPVTLALHYGGGCGSQQAPAFPAGPAWSGPGIHGQYGPLRSRAGGGGRGGGGPRRQPMCAKCRAAGKQG
ncbi:unnamed protein product [Ectocarpus sp. CCAP 1310/34]|nr:unnamed protein product [Ectocarpus sp. CCAP 1310/34]